MSDLAQGSSRNQAPTPEQLRNKELRSVWLILFGLLGFYLLIFLRYRPYDIDNPWFLSFSYNACIEHIKTDQFMQVNIRAGMDGRNILDESPRSCSVLC